MAELVSYQQSLLLKPTLTPFIDENNSQVELENDLDNIDKNCLNGMPSESENHTPTESYQSTNEETQFTNETILHVLSTAPLQTLGNLSIGTITKVDIAEAPKPIWIEKNETAKRIHGRIETIFDYAKTMGYFEGENPAEWKGNLEPILGNLKQESRPHPSLPYEQIAEFIQHLRQKKGISPKALEFTILTACRSGEVFGAKWQEIDFKNKVWIIPKERMKVEKEHNVFYLL